MRSQMEYYEFGKTIHCFAQLETFALSGIGSGAHVIRCNKSNEILIV